MWQIWNEPNIYPFWPFQPFEARYVALLTAAHKAIKSVDPSAKVVLAGMPNYSWINLQRIYKISGARSQFDVVAIHPYTKDPRGVITILGFVREVMNQAGDTTKPIIADEISWPSSIGKTDHDTGYDFASTESGQAQKIKQVLPLLVADRKKLGLAGFYYYDWAGRERQNDLAFDFAGLFRLSNGQFVAKPAFNAYRHAALAMEDCSSKGQNAASCSP
jgi:arabinogalactan endo-1,4-beta-galactosidase